MLSICAVLILIILGLFFIKKDTQKELTNFVKENAMLLGIALLLFLFYGRNMIEGAEDFEEEEERQKKEEEGRKKKEEGEEEEEGRKKKEEEEEEEEGRKKKEEEEEEGVRSNRSIDRPQSINVRPQPSESEYASPFNNVDANDNGIISKDEFDKAMGNMKNIKGPVKENNATKETFEMFGKVYPMPEGMNNTGYAPADV